MFYFGDTRNKEEVKFKCMPKKRHQAMKFVLKCEYGNSM